MKILAIETSCDETAASVVEDGVKIISNVVASSASMHEKWGGIVPEVAAREQLKSIIPVLMEALNIYSSSEVPLERDESRSQDFNSSRPSDSNNKLKASRGKSLALPKGKLSFSLDNLTASNAADTMKPPYAEASGGAAIQQCNNETMKQLHRNQKTADNKDQLFAYKQVIEKEIDAIAVTVGPGLIGSLLIGTECAKTIAYVTGIPIIPVNHVLAHMYANFITNGDEKIPNSKSQFPNNVAIQQFNNVTISFPAISLVVSGGHTELYLMTSPKDLKWLGGTIDDAAGECFDKTARLLGFGSRGGLAIQEAANNYELRITNYELRLPRPLLHEQGLNFSFSGLKTAVLREVNKPKNQQQPARNASRSDAGGFNNVTIQQLSYEVQESITDVLVKKTLQAVQQYDAKSVLISGGVASNLRLREKMAIQIEKLNQKILPERSRGATTQPPLALKHKTSGGAAIQKCNSATIKQFNNSTIENKIDEQIKLFVPPISLCTDNAAYIASYAYFRGTPIPWREIKAQPDLSVEVEC